MSLGTVICSCVISRCVHSRLSDRSPRGGSRRGLASTFGRHPCRSCTCLGSTRDRITRAEGPRIEPVPLLGHGLLAGQPRPRSGQEARRPAHGRDQPLGRGALRSPRGGEHPTGGNRPQAERNLGIDPQGSAPTASSVNGRGRAGQDCAAQRRPRPSSRSRPARRPWGRFGDSRALEFSTRRCRMAPRAVGGGKRSSLSGADLGTISDLGSQNRCAAPNSYS